MYGKVTVSFKRNIHDANDARRIIKDFKRRNNYKTKTKSFFDILYRNTPYSLNGIFCIRCFRSFITTMKSNDNNTYNVIKHRVYNSLINVSLLINCMITIGKTHFWLHRSLLYTDLAKDWNLYILVHVVIKQCVVNKIF